MNILVTGGAGYIGSHTVIALVEAGYKPIIVDSLVNSSSETINTLRSLTNTDLQFYDLDIRDNKALEKIMKQHEIRAVIHFAALKAVGESVEQPLSYYDNNIGGLISVLLAMQQNKVNKLLFSSSATVYGEATSMPITEASPLLPATNPYGATKQMAERIIEDVCKATDTTALLLRYFNPIGAHESGKIGESPNGVPNNLVPYLLQAAAGIRKSLTIYGDDYPTSDGTGVRDYMHVMDLAEAHVRALDHLIDGATGCDAINIGTGKGTSVLELVKAFETATGQKVPYNIGKRRSGDIASCYAAVDKAAGLLNWRTSRTIEQALIDAWRWQKNSSTKDMIQ